MGLAEEGDVGAGAGAVVGVGGGEMGGEETLLGVDADLGAGEEDDDAQEEHGPPGEAEAGGEQQQEHGGVDGVAEETVGAGLDELVVGAERGLVTPLFAEMAGGSPGECDRRWGEQHGGDEGRRGLVQVGGTDAEEDAEEADALQDHAPERGGGANDFLLSGGDAAGTDEDQGPGDPAEDEFEDGGALEHGVIVCGGR